MPVIRNKKTWTLTGYDYPRALVVGGSFLYVGLYTSPAVILKVNRSTGAVADSWTGNSDEDLCLDLDWDGSYLYAALNTDPQEGGCVMKIDVSDMSEADDWVHPGEDRARSVHCFGGYIYVGDNADDTSNVYKIDPSDMGTDDTWTSGTSLDTVYALTNDGTYIYAGGQNSTPAIVEKIDVSDMSTVATWTGDNETHGEADVDCLVWDGSYLYAGLDTTGNDTRVVKIDTSDMSTNARWDPGGSNYDYAFSGLYRSPYLYFGIEEGRQGVVRINPSDLSVQDYVVIGSTSQSCIANSGDTIYFGQVLTSAKVYVLGETTGPFPTHFRS